MVGHTGMVGVLSDLMWCVKIIIIIILYIELEMKSHAVG